MDRPGDGRAVSVPHRVGRLRFELDGGAEAPLLRLRSAIVTGAESWIPAALDDAFAALCEPGRSIHIHRLEIDLGLLPPAGMTPALLAEGVRAALSRQIDVPAPGTLPPRIVEEAVTLADTLRYFLRHGRLPWWSVVETVAELELRILGAGVGTLRELARAVAAILAQPRGARRLVLQFTAEAGARLAGALPGAWPSAFAAADWPTPADRAAVDDVVGRIRRAAESALRDRDETADEPRAGGDDSAHASPRAQTVITEEADMVEGVSRESDLGDFIAVADAGLVLLHPFLAPLFEACGLATNGRFAGTDAQQRAVQLTGWLASGTTTAPEPALVMAKLLCGWPLDEPLPRESDLSAADCGEAEAMMHAVISHWSALGKASPEALRETFLARPGRLSESDDAWRLEVEQRGADVLLERLPWAVSSLRLPWMARPLFVDWQ
jgi:hypothetical protein